MGKKPSVIGGGDGLGVYQRRPYQEGRPLLGDRPITDAANEEFQRSAMEYAKRKGIPVDDFFKFLATYTIPTPSDKDLTHTPPIKPGMEVPEYEPTAIWNPLRGDTIEAVGRSSYYKK